MSVGFLREMGSNFKEVYRISNIEGAFFSSWVAGQLKSGKTYLTHSISLYAANGKKEISLSRTEKKQNEDIFPEEMVSKIEEFPTQFKDLSTQLKDFEKKEDLLTQIYNWGSFENIICDFDRYYFLGENHFASLDLVDRKPEFHHWVLQLAQAGDIKSVQDTQRMRDSLVKFSLPKSCSYKRSDFETNTDGEDNQIYLKTMRATRNPDQPFVSSGLRLHFDTLEDLYNTNYSQKVSASIISLVKQLKENIFTGKMIFFHGKPGTGKTYLIKSLLGELQEDFLPILVTNPLAFMQTNGYEYALSEYSKEKTLIFIFEDSEKLVASDARDVLPDEFSALANITSGLIGSGRDDLFLFTFNRPIEKIDEALLRECRCAGDIEIGEMDSTAVENFEKRHGKLGLEVPCTLANAYSKLFTSQVSLKSENKKIGFGG